MLNILRLLLSLLVVQSHIYPLGHPWLAWYSVFAFYTISGYLMTLVLNETYGFSLSGTKAFLLNRFLRLAPAYYATITLSAATSYLLFPLSNFDNSLALPQNSFEWLTNLTVIGQASFDNSLMVVSRLADNSWSLSIEIFCYFLLAIGFARNIRYLLILLTLGVILNFYSHYNAIHKIFSIVHDYSFYGFQNHYGVIHAGMIPFALGGLSYFYRSSIRSVFSNKIKFLLVVFLALFIASFTSKLMQYVIGLYATSALISISIPLLIDTNFEFLSLRSQKYLGDLAYPIFISHWVIAAIIANSITALASKSLGLFITTLIGSILFSLPIINIEQKIQKIRSKIKNSPRISSPEALTTL